MIMDEMCPYCKSKDFDYINTEEEFDCDSNYVRYDCVCNKCNEEFIISTVYGPKLSCIVAKNDIELDELIKKEEQE